MKRKILIVFLILSICLIAIAATNLVITKAPGKLGTGKILSTSPITAANAFAAAATTMEFSNDGNVILIIDNQHNSTSTTISYTMPLLQGMTITAPSTVQPPDTLYLYGPFPTGIYNDSSGKVQVSISTNTTVFAGTIRL